MNDNQNAFVKRPTSRVLSEPGGKATFNLFGGGGSGGKAAAPPIVTPRNVEEPAPAANEEEAPKEEAPEEETPEKEEETPKEEKEEEESAMSAAARIKAKNEAQHFTLFSSPSKGKKPAAPTSSNAFASASTTNSYNVITDRSTSRVVSFVSAFFGALFFVVG